MSQFHNFEQLPPEIRHKIWTLARERRRIAVHAQPPRAWQSLLRQPLLAPVPALLHACRESRLLMSRVYQKAFFDASPAYAGGAPAYTWVDYGADVLCIREVHLPLLALGPRRHLVRHVEVRCDLGDRLLYTARRRRCFWHGAALFELARLRTAVLVNESALDVAPLDRWPAVAFGIMIDCYATCRPVGFRVCVVDRASPDLGELTRANFRRHLAETQPIEVSDVAGLDVYALPEDEVWTAWDSSDGAGWKHVGCECEHVPQREQRS